MLRSVAVLQSAALLQATAPYEIVSFTNCFHGRTMGALALTYKEQYKTPFQPVMPGQQCTASNQPTSSAPMTVILPSCNSSLIVRCCQ